MTIVYFQHMDLCRPVLKVLETEDQVLIAIRSESNEHLTLHRQRDGSTLLTHWSPDKPQGTCDRERVSAARSLGWSDPERHAHYYIHQPLFSSIGGMDGYELLGRRIKLEAAKPSSKYDHARQIVLNAPGREFMLRFVLSTAEQPYSAVDEPHVETRFGGLYFRPTAGIEAE